MFVIDNYRLNIPLSETRLQINIDSNDTLSSLEESIREGDSSISTVEFNTVDQGPNVSFLRKSEHFRDHEDTPFLMTLDNTETYVIKLGEGHSAVKHTNKDDIFEPNEESFYMYCKSIGIPNKNSEILAAFLDKTYNGIPSLKSKTEDIKSNIFNSLAAFRSLPENKWNTSKASELKKILDKKEKELVTQNFIKEGLDKKALRRANSILYLGGSVLMGQFWFIMSGTYFYFCWDVMEPMAYLMLTSNLTVGFGYYWWTRSEFDFEPLQGKFKSRIARKIYIKNKFDIEEFQELKGDVVELRALINNSV